MQSNKETEDLGWTYNAGNAWDYGEGGLVSIPDALSATTSTHSYRFPTVGTDRAINIFDTLTFYQQKGLIDLLAGTTQVQDGRLNLSGLNFGDKPLFLDMYKVSIHQYPGLKKNKNPPEYTITEDSLGSNVKDIIGTHGDDFIAGSYKDEVIYGRKGDDVLAGRGSDDKILGGNGTDTINGGAGEDHIFGGVGDDTLSGGAGADYFYMRPGSTTYGSDTISDFTIGTDVIRLLTNSSTLGNVEIETHWSGAGVAFQETLRVGNGNSDYVHLWLQNVTLAQVNNAINNGTIVYDFQATNYFDNTSVDVI